MSDSAAAPLLPPAPGGGAEQRHAGGSALGVYIAVALTALGPVSFGYVLGFSSPAAAPLLASGLLSARQLNVFEALSPLGAVVGAGCAGVAADTFGRTRALALSCAPFALGWGLISAAQVRAQPSSRAPLNRPAPAGGTLTKRARLRFAQGVGTLFLGRLLTGAGVGCVLNITPVYVAEIAPTTCVPPQHAPCAQAHAPLPCPAVLRRGPAAGCAARCWA